MSKETKVERLMRYAEALACSYGQASYTQGYRSREKPYGGPEELRLHEREMLQWDLTSHHRERLRRALQRALRGAP